MREREIESDSVTESKKTRTKEEKAKEVEKSLIEILVKFIN